MMSNIVYALKALFKHLYKNASNYLFSIGLLLIIRFIFITFGLEAFLLTIGILLIIYSFILEINKNKKKY